MKANANFSGVIAPVVTPWGEDGAPDLDRFVEHCEWLLEEGCTALAPFGTTSEGNSLGLDERMEMLEELVDSGVDPKKLMPGTGACSVSDAIILTEHAVEMGCGGVLMLPPFYYKSPSEEGLFRFFAEVIEEVGDDALKIYLYHIPPVAQVGFPLSLIGRLIKEFPKSVVGLKDSSGDWSNTKAILDAFPNFEVVPGLGDLSARRAAQRCGGLHLGHRQRVGAGDPRRVRRLAGRRRRQAAGGHHRLAQGDPGLAHDPGAEGADRALPPGSGLGQGAPTVHGPAGGRRRQGRPDAGGCARLQARVRGSGLKEGGPSGEGPLEFMQRRVEG